MYIDFQKIKLFRSQRRRLLLAILDLAILILSIWLSFWLRLGNQAPTKILNFLWLFPSVISFGIPIYIFTGQYKALTRHVGSGALYEIIGRNLLIILCVSLFGVMCQFTMPPRSTWILIWMLLSVLIGGLRFILRDFILRNRKKLNQKNLLRETIVIYGAGSVGAKIASSLKESSNILFFVDDSPSLKGRTLDGIEIKHPAEIEKYKDRIDKILFSISALSNNRRKSIINNLKTFEIPVYTIPSIEDIITKKVEINLEKTIPIENLLGRGKVPPDKNLLGDHIVNNVILITGAGGSIGSELCKQLINLNPQKLILLEISEHALYQIEKDLKNIQDSNSIIQGYLGDACDENLLRTIFKEEKIDIVFHTAAYKHVPIVEENPLIGIKNNVFSTRAICRVSKTFNVSKVLLISTDKAVRPKNIMGSSKRLAELIIQGFSKEIESDKNSTTKFSMVRFGNVLNSSGSVIPVFKDQISKGGPITVTHPDIMRYFMTIEEASQLVIQASKLTLGGDLFVLDMGKPVKILELAKQMVNLSGLEVKDKNNPNGDIEIVFTGLRPGEKLFEELLIDAESLKTSHPLIFRAVEKCIEPDLLWRKLEELEHNINLQKKESCLEILSDLVPEWK